MYATLKATVRGGQIQLLAPYSLKENTSLLVTVLDSDDHAYPTLGEHLMAGLEDILQGRVSIIETPQELSQHLDTLFDRLNDTEEDLEAEDAAYSRHEDKFTALAQAALAEIKAGSTPPMFDEQGEFTNDSR